MPHQDEFNHSRSLTVRRLLEQSFTLSELDDTQHYFARDFRLHAPLFPVLPARPSAWTTAIRFFLTGLCDVKLIFGCGCVENERVALSFVVEGMHTGPFGQLVATHRAIRVSGLSLWRFDGPVIAEAWLEFGLFGALLPLEVFELVNSVSVLES